MFLVLFVCLVCQREMYSYLSLSQTIKAVMDSEHGVTLDDAHPDCCTDGGVHTSTGSTDVHDGHIDVALISQIKTEKKEMTKWLDNGKKKV